MITWSDNFLIMIIINYLKLYNCVQTDGHY